MSAVKKYYPNSYRDLPKTRHINFHNALYEQYKVEYFEQVELLHVSIDGFKNSYNTTLHKFTMTGGRPVVVSLNSDTDKEFICDVICDFYIPSKLMPSSINMCLAINEDRDYYFCFLSKRFAKPPVRSDKLFTDVGYNIIWADGSTSFLHYDARDDVQYKQVFEVGEFDIELADDMPIVVGYNDIELVD